MGVHIHQFLFLMYVRIIVSNFFLDHFWFVHAYISVYKLQLIHDIMSIETKQLNNFPIFHTIPPMTKIIAEKKNIFMQIGRAPCREKVQITASTISHMT